MDTATKSSKSVWDVIQEQYQKYNTFDNKSEDFEVGDAVRIITPAQDFNFFDMNNSYGRVIRKGATYIMMIVLVVDIKRESCRVFNFEPKDIIKIPDEFAAIQKSLVHYFENDNLFFNPIYYSKVLYLDTKEPIIKIRDVIRPFFVYFKVEAVVINYTESPQQLEYFYVEDYNL